MNRFLITPTILCTATVFAGGAFSPASAQDERPCVSQVEYQSTPGVLKFNIRGAAAGRIDHDKPLLRKELEVRWDVRGLGTIDPDSDAQITIWVYPRCGYSIENGQVLALSTGRDGIVDVIAKAKVAGATGNGAYLR